MVQPGSFSDGIINKIHKLLQADENSNKDKFKVLLVAKVRHSGISVFKKKKKDDPT